MLTKSGLVGKLSFGSIGSYAAPLLTNILKAATISSMWGS